MRTMAVMMLMGLPVWAESQETKPVWTVEAGAEKRPVSPTLYGIFFEDINHAADGGLYAELVRNRSFEDTVVPERCTVENGTLCTPRGWKTPFPDKDPLPGWTFSARDGAIARMTLDDKETSNPARKRSLRIEVDSIEGGSVAAINTGFWGIPLKSGESYKLSFFAKAKPGFGGSVRVSLIGSTEKGGVSEVYAAHTFDGIATEWRRYEAVLESAATDTQARLAIAPLSTGTLWLDTVSLFPKRTWKDRENGLREGLAAMLADLHPAFVRFPGGCFVEGFTLETALNWKNTIGPIEARKSHWNLWGYMTSNGLGYHGLLQLCEDLGAEPLFVINCGMACQGRGGEAVPMEQIEPWIQDALDGIEYANGPADSAWGKVRASNGHPEPFHLKYIEIGNENLGPNYEERYARFQRAIKDRYPEIQIVANTRVRSAPLDILDEHYYSSPAFFIGQAHKYDDYDRSGPKIYVGEYAVVSDCGKGNLRAALGEAAFMTGMERNADIVTMASYAPLFVNVNDRTWNPDAIVFDNARCCGTPSYHVQCLFARNRCATTIPGEIACTAETQDLHGAIGLATWNTQAEFKDVKVTGANGTALFTSDFGQGASEWKQARGVWKVKEGAYQQTGEDVDLRTVTGVPAWGDYTVTLKARKLGGQEGFMVMVRVRDDNNWIWWNVGGWGNHQHGIEQMRDGQKSDVGSRVDGAIETGRWYDVQVDVQGARIRCLLDGRVVHEATLPSLPVLTGVAGFSEQGDTLILKAVNTTREPLDTQIVLNGVTNMASEGTAEVLTSAAPADENSLEAPRKIAPVTRAVTGVAPTFRYTFDPYSVTVLRVSTKRY